MVPVALVLTVGIIIPLAAHIESGAVGLGATFWALIASGVAQAVRRIRRMVMVRAESNMVVIAAGRTAAVRRMTTM